MRPVPLFIPVALLLLAAAPPARTAMPEPKEGDGWCDFCAAFVDAKGHEKTHADARWCERCEGFYPSEHTHLGAAPLPVATDSSEETASTAASTAPTVPTVPEGRFFALLKRYWWALPILLVVWFVLLALLRALKTSSEWLPTVGGVPQGVALEPGRLVCAETGSGDGGTAVGYRGAIKTPRGWRRAFVKRMVGKGMRQDVRFPALRFEAQVLDALAETGVVPRVLVEPVERNLGGEVWSYYVMSVAPGAPWPDRGGLGADTHRALAALCEALVMLHEQGIGHHDLKPQNIFWESRGRRLTLIDFGSAIDHSESVRFVNPLGGTYPKTIPWVAPEGDGRCLADLSPASDVWVFGLLLCEALVGGIHEEDRTKRRWPERPGDRDWLKERLAEAESPTLAEAVVEGLFALSPSRRTPLRTFLDQLRKEWDV